MVTAKTQYNLKNAREYFEEHLCVGDYYDEGQRVAGEWVGVGAERLGLAGKVRADDFLRMCENQNPGTGEKLTQRQNTTRTEGDKNTANRRIFYDFTFSPPKSVSIVGFLGNDERIFEAHARAVQAALKNFEAFAATRVRVGGVRNERLTGNFVAAKFTHDTSRALDPHLHTHCIVFNATFDAVENRWKALENYELLRARKFAENIYYHEFARDLKTFGYRIRNRSRGDFEIEGVSEEICRRFSKRDAEIDAALAKLLADHPELGGANIAELRAKLATEKRTRKQKDLSRDELRRLWEAQLSKSEQSSLRQLSEQPKHDAKEEKRVNVGEAVQWAEEHLFDRNSVVLECQLWQEALGRARGENFSVSDLKEFTRRRGYIRDEARPGEVTLREVLLREWEIVQIAKQGVADCHTLVANPQPLNPKLDDEQRKALAALLGSTDRISIFRGGAGTGKSFVLGDLVEQVQQTGRCVVVLAPQRQQVVDMEKAGFPSPTTVANFLLKREVATGALIVLDEAGQIGGRQMLELLRLARDKNARVILSGDTRQHGAVEASDALLVIERHSGIKPVELHTIQALDKLDLTNAQKRDDRFYPPEAVVVFNQKVRTAKPGATGKLAGIVKLGVLVEVDGKFVTVSNKLLDRITVCQQREITLSTGDKLHLKANRKLATGGRVTNGELVAVKSVRADGAVELADGRVLDKSFREFLPGYAVTSYGSQGKTVDHVLFSDSTIKAATNAQQWYVTISRGRRGIRIFTPDKQQLRENVTRPGHRPLAIEFATGFVPRRNNRLWNRLHGYMLRFGQRAADHFVRLTLARRQRQQPKQKYEHKITRMLGE